jgi:hypothetical protein
MNALIRAALTVTIAVGLTFGAAAQSQSKATSTQKSGSEKTVEEAYLQESAEILLVKELARSDEKDNKVIALAYARKAIDAGHKNDEIRSSLQDLALEGMDVVSRSGGLGPAINSYPDVRAKACEYLSDFPSVETKNTLLRVIKNTKTEDPMVLCEAIRSLGKIGMNDNDETVQAISNAITHYANVGSAEDRLAVYTLFAFTDIAEKNNGIKDMSTVSNTVMQFTKGSYVGAVRRLAMQTLEKLASYPTKGASSGK